MKTHKLLLLPGDGIGPEIMAEVEKALQAISDLGLARFETESDLVGGASIDARSTPLSDATLELAREADATLFGAVGGPKWDGKGPFHLRPEVGILGLRKGLGLYANLRPARCYAPLASASSLHGDLVAGLDILIVRELTGGIYFGQPKEIVTLEDGQRRAVDTQIYTTSEVERIARVAFGLARRRRNLVHSTEKNNVMRTGTLWRETVAALHEREFGDIRLEHILADNCGMQLVRRPGQFDVLVMDNLFGDILSDVAAMLTGSLGMLPSASLGDVDPKTGRRPALYEPIHGSAPDIAGQGRANPLAMVGSLAMALRYSLDEEDLAERVETAIKAVLAQGLRTADIATPGQSAISTAEMGSAVAEALHAGARQGGRRMRGPLTLFDKIWDAHLVETQPDGTALLYIDRHLVHEVSSPQAFEALRLAGRTVRAPRSTLAVVDHNIPTINRAAGISDPDSRLQVETLKRNAGEYGIEFFGTTDRRQGIVHVIGPEQGFTLPGATIVCGDSHTSTHGAFGAFAMGIGTSEIEHVLATQTLVQRKPRNMRVTVEGSLPDGVSAKDVILAIIGKIGTAGATGHVIEYAGEAIRSLSMEGRMTVCNMSIEAGARAGLIAPDEKTYAFLADRPRSPKGDMWERARRAWDQLQSDDGAHFDKQVRLDAGNLPPLVTWGTSPEDVVAVDGAVPDPAGIADETKRRSKQQALDYMGLIPGQRITDIPLDRVFIGSCTNGRIEDLRLVARMVRGQRVHERVSAMIVPGSGPVRQQAESEGLDCIFVSAGFEWREPGCSMCLAMNPDRLEPGERCASTSNRNFEGRQGYRGRTHLVSPAMAAAAAIAGRFVDVRQWP